MKKRILLVVVILVFILIVVSYIYLNQTKNYDLEKRFGIHGNVIEYGTYDKSDDVSEYLEKFEDIFVENLAKGKQTYFVYGNDKEIRVASYEEVINGNIRFVIGEKTQNFKVRENKYLLRILIPDKNKVTVLVGNSSYDFELRPNENLYFIISEEIK